MSGPLETPLHRRAFIASAVTPLAVSALATTGSIAKLLESRIRAVAFDGFAIFDATKIVNDADVVVPGHARELVTTWRARQFEYQWLRTLGGRYANFRQTADDALSYATRALGLKISPEQHARLLDAQSTLEPWPDAAKAVGALRDAGLRLAFLSNMTESMLHSGSMRAGFRDAFELVLSTDRVKASKPDPRAYRMAADAFGLERDRIAFVAFAGWDAAGASWFGYPTVWMNRMSAPADALGNEPRAVARDLREVVSFVRSV